MKTCIVVTWKKSHSTLLVLKWTNSSSIFSNF